MNQHFENVLSTGENMKEISVRNFLRWNEALKTKDAKRVAELYSDDATFLPTAAGDFKKGKAGAEDYFIHFLEKNPTGETVQEEIQVLGPNCYLSSGMYNFELGPKEDRNIKEARFSFVWRSDNEGEWKIVHHHSSVKPTN
jgi:uncharacterized protein (TIGR02246 family)